MPWERSVRVLAGCLGLLLIAAGCVSKGDLSSSPAAYGDDGGLGIDAPSLLEPEPGFIAGIVVDPELMPINEVTITVTGDGLPEGVIGTTDAGGAFKIGPFPDGGYTVIPEKQGYKGEPVAARVSGEEKVSVRITLEPIAGNVPYHETLPKTLLQYCGIALVVATPVEDPLPATAPCGFVVDYALQTATMQPHSNTIDQSSFDFTIENPGFSSLVMGWCGPRNSSCATASCS